KRAEEQAKADERMHQHWKAENGEIVFDGKGTASAPRKIMAILRCWWIGKFRQRVTVEFMCAAPRRCKSGKQTVPANSNPRMVPADCITTRSTRAIRSNSPINQSANGIGFAS